MRHGVPWEILGWGIKWQGLSQKLQASLDAVKSLSPDCIVLFSDAFDVLFTQDVQAIKRAFLATRQDLLFAGECGCWPQVIKDKDRGLKRGTICNQLYPKSPTPYRYLNSGAWIGRAGAAQKLLAAVVDRANSQFGLKTNDQEMVSDMYIEGKFDIALDHHARVFQCMHDTGAPPLPRCQPWEHVVNDNGVWRNQLTNTTPALYHFNGGGKAHHLEMEAAMWYKRRSSSPAELRQLYDTELVFHDRFRKFGEICPGHLEKAAGGGKAGRIRGGRPR